MRTRFIATAMVFLCVIVGGLVVHAPAASAHVGGPPSDCREVSNGWGRTCFEWAGDDQWVYDDSTDGMRVGVDIEFTYDKVRTCENTHGSGTWHECTFDHREDSCLRFRLYRKVGSVGPVQRSNWSSWYRISNGNRC